MTTLGVLAPNTLRDQWERSTLRRSLRWLCSRHGARGVVVGLAGLTVLILLFYGVENVRGRRAWNRCKADLEARGVRVEFSAFIPPPVPDEQNFAMTPLFKELDFEPRPLFLPGFGTETDFRRRETKLDQINVGLPPGPGNHGQRQQPPSRFGSLHSNALIQLRSWQEFYRGNTNYPNAPTPQTPGRDVLTALSRIDGDLQELRQAAVRPAARFPIRYDADDPATMVLPHLAPVKRIAEVLLLKSTAELDQGQAVEALADLRLGFRLADTLTNEPFLVSFLVRRSVELILLQGVQEGLARHAWSDAQLEELDRQLASVNLLAECRLALDGDVAVMAGDLDCYQRQGFRCWPYALICHLAPASWSDRGKRIMWQARVAPGGWFEQNKAALHRWNQELLAPQMDLKKQRVFPQEQARAEAAFARIEGGPYQAFARLLFGPIARTSQPTAHAQTTVNQVRLACALERYRLAHAAFPDALEALVPRIMARLPHDLINGEPLHYRRTDDGYLLYSVGWDEKDDGGQIVFYPSTRKASVSTVDPSKGDWVWRWPPEK